MVNLNEILSQYLREQISLEEQLFQDIEAQIEELNGSEFADAKSILKNTSATLEKHFLPLNALLDTLENDALKVKNKGVQSNGLATNGQPKGSARKSASRMLRDDYSALNRITISNTLLHTTALALERLEVATMALEHLENLAPLVVKIGDMMPTVIARELHSHSPSIKLSIADTALQNTRNAWRSAS